MIVRSLSSLSIYSDTHSAADVTATLGIEPTKSSERGDRVRTNLDLPQFEPIYKISEHSRWWLEADEARVDPQDETGFGSLRVLVAMLRGKESALARLRPDYNTIIWWSGFSDSEQGGFVMPADLLAELGGLGCDLYGTTYLDWGDGEDDDSLIGEV